MRDGTAPSQKKRKGKRINSISLLLFVLFPRWARESAWKIKGGNENGLLARWYFFEWKKKGWIRNGTNTFFLKNCLFLFVEKRVRATQSFFGDSIIRLLFLGG